MPHDVTRPLHRGTHLQDASPSALAYSFVAFCGAISGFFLSGHFGLAAIAFVALAAGAATGWFARGLAR